VGVEAAYDLGCGDEKVDGKGDKKPSSARASSVKRMPVSRVIMAVRGRVPRVGTLRNFVALFALLHDLMYPLASYKDLAAKHQS
jgi:hypothetical protein